MIIKAQAIAKSAVTWITLIAVVLQEAVATIANAGIDDGATELIVAWGGRGVTLLLGVIAVITRVTPVAKADRGLLS